MNATSSSDRYEAARAALTHYEAHDPKTTAIWGNNIVTGEDVEPYSITDAAASMAAALRALIDPPATDESPADIAMSILTRNTRGYGDDRMVTRMTVEAVRAGILAAWESWEPESANVAYENDQRLTAWHRVASHPFFADCYRGEAPLIDTMIAKLDRTESRNNA